MHTEPRDVIWNPQSHQSGNPRMQPGAPAVDGTQRLCVASCSLEPRADLDTHPCRHPSPTCAVPTPAPLPEPSSRYLGGGEGCLVVIVPGRLAPWPPQQHLPQGATVLRKGRWCHCLPGHCATGPSDHVAARALWVGGGRRGSGNCTRPPECSGSQHLWWA